MDDYTDDVRDALTNEKKVHVYKLSAILFQHLPEIQKKYSRAITTEDFSKELTQIVGAEVNTDLADKTLLDHKLAYCRHVDMSKGYR